MFWTVLQILLSFGGWIAHGLRCQKCIYVCYSDGNKQVISLGLVAGIQNVENNSCFFMDSDEIKKYLGDNDVCVCARICEYSSILWKTRKTRG